MVGVGGSNPLAPTNKIRCLDCKLVHSFVSERPRGNMYPFYVALPIFDFSRQMPDQVEHVFVVSPFPCAFHDRWPGG